MKNSPIQSGTGISPAAPWMRSWRAASRSEVWSSHLPYAASCWGEVSSTRCSVPNIATPHGLMSSPSVPFSMRSHSPWMTERA